MIIHGADSDKMPFIFDTARIEATYCYLSDNGLWRVVLDFSNGREFLLLRNNSIKINGVDITHQGDMEGCKKMAEIINTIIELERQDPPVDMDKFSKIAVAKPKRKNSK